MVTIGAPRDPAHVVDLFSESVPGILAEGAAEVTLGRRVFRLRRDFVSDIRQQPQLERISRLKRALLVMHAPADETVGIDSAREIFDAARHPKSVMALDGTDHLLTHRRDAEIVADIISAWSDRYTCPG